MENMTSTQLAQLLYVAYYGRPADASGLTFWAEQIDAVGVEGVAADFGASAEFEARFGDLTNEELVQNLYQQLFGRDGEQAGVDYWVNLLENGTSLAEIALEIANGAQNADITAINNKVAVAQRFTEAAGDDYAGDDAANIARDFLLTVDADTDAETADVEGALDSVADLTTFTLAEAQAAEALPAKYTIEDSAANLVAAASAAAVTTLANAEAIVVAGDATVEQMNALINVSEYSNIESYTLNDTVENLLAGGDIVANAASATVAGEPVLTVAQYNEIAAVATVETYTVVDTAEAILEAGADAAALANAGSVAITDEAVTLEQAVALDALSLDVAYPAVDVSLEAAAAADTLPANYALTADVFAAGEVTVEAATAAFGAVSAIVEGAANAEELAVADLFTWSIADTLENIEAADAAVLEGVEYTLTNEAGDLGELTGEQYQLVLGATNADAYTYTVVPAPVSSISAEGPVVEGNDIAFTVEMEYAVNVDRVISYQVAGAETGTAGAADALEDLGQITGTVTIPAGETTGTITLTPVEDGTTEGREAFIVELLNDEGTEVVATSNVVVIEDDANAGRNITLSDSVDTIEPSAGNDTITGTITTDGTGEGEEIGGTLSTLDSINTGANSYDTLRINDISTKVDVNENIAGLQIQNVNEFQIRSANDFTLDSTGFAGTELLNVLQGNSIKLTAAEDTAIQVAGIQKDGSVTLTDGSTQTIDLTNEGITVDVEGAAGAVSVTSADQGSGSIDIDDGTDVTVEATADKSSGAINIGQGDTELPSGEINVTQNLNSDGTEELNGGAINVKGGTSVNVTVNATSVAEDEGDDNDINVGNINVTGDDNTTDVTVVQNRDVTQFTKDAVAAVPATQTVTFKALAAGETTTVGGLTFTAGEEDLTAEQVAQAFSELAFGGDTQDAGGPVANGVYTGQLNTAWSSAAANGAQVVFTANSADPGALTVTDGAVDPTSDYQAGTAAEAEVESANDVNFGKVTIADNDEASITTITVDGYADDDTASSINADALETLSLSNGEGKMDVTTAATALDVTVDNVRGNVSLDEDKATVTDLNLTVNGDNATDGLNSKFSLTAQAVENFDLTANANINLSGSDIGTTDALQTVVVSGAGSVNLGEVEASENLESFNASANTGGVVATVNADTATVAAMEDGEYVFSEGNDNVTLSTNTVDVAVSLGGGNDVLELNSYANGEDETTLSVTLDGGAGTNTLKMGADDAAARSQNVDFEGNLANFQKLHLALAEADATDTTVDMANMADIDYVISDNSVGEADTKADLTSDAVTAAAGSLDETQDADSDVVSVTNGSLADSPNPGDPAVATTATFNLAGLVLDTNGTLTLDGQTLFSAASDGVNASTIANNLLLSTITLGGVEYAISTSGTEVTLTDATGEVYTGPLSFATTGEAIDEGNTQQYNFDIDGLVLDNDGTLTFGGVELYSATEDGVDAEAIAAAIDGETFTIDGEEYTVTATGTAINLESTGKVVDQGAKTVATTGLAVTAGAATLTLDNFADDGTLELVEAGAGVNVNVDGADEEGADANVLNLVTKVAVEDLDFGTVTADAVETININVQDTNVDENDDGVEYEAGDRDEAQLTLSADAAENVVITGNSDLDLTADAAELASVNATAMTGSLTFTADVADLEVNAGSGNDTLTAAANDVVLNGGAGNDTLTVEAGADRADLFGGEGNDLFVIDGASTSSSTYAIIKDINAGDKVTFTGAVSFREAEVTLSAGASESTQELANQAVKDLGENELGWFQFGGNTFIVQDLGDTEAGVEENFINGTDKILMIEGEVDLSTASFNDDIDTTGTTWLEIA